MEKLKLENFLLRALIILWIISFAAILTLRLIVYRRTGVFEYGSAVYALVIPGFLVLMVYYLQTRGKK
ncbi:MAG TPA: hypothetical protein VGB68_04265 [Pyrinomonadaceae bacterium]|jgi:hypothetical protein